MKKYLKLLSSSIVAGLLISIGGFVFLTTKNVSLVLSGFLFAFGLFIIITLKLDLYTGKIGYIFENKPSFLLDLLIILLGNCIGAVLMGYIIRLTTLYDTRLVEIVNQATSVCNIKLDSSILTAFILSIFCGFMIFFAVEVSKREVHPLFKVVAIFFAVAIFVICGFEHCVANMFYFSLANCWSLNSLLYIIIMIIGNSFGSILLYLLLKLAGKK